MKNIRKTKNTQSKLKKSKSQCVLINHSCSPKNRIKVCLFVFVFSHWNLQFTGTSTEIIKQSLLFIYYLQGALFEFEDGKFVR